MKGVYFLRGRGQSVFHHNRYQSVDTSSGVLVTEIKHIVSIEWFTQDHHGFSMGVYHHLTHRNKV